MRERKDTGINGRPDLLLLHDLRNLLQLCSVGADEQKPIFLSLPFGGFVIFAASQREQQFLEAEKMIFQSKGFVRAGSQADNRPPFFRTANSCSNSAAPKVSITWSTPG